MGFCFGLFVTRLIFFKSVSCFFFLEALEIFLFIFDFQTFHLTASGHECYFPTPTFYLILRGSLPSEDQSHYSILQLLVEFFLYTVLSHHLLI